MPKGYYQRPSIETRFWATVEKTDTCWLWRGELTPNGYGRFNWREPDGMRRRMVAHRFAYERWVGPIPPGLQIDHVKVRGCTHRNCVRLDHLEPVTPRENAKRGTGFAAMHMGKTHCKAGHPFDEANTRIRGGKRPGNRVCRACHRISLVEQRARKRRNG